jgi:2-haloacid dehalogenase
MIQVAVFDAYGTLLDVNAAMRRHADRLGPDWQRISQEWRIKHIEYTWVLSLAGRYRSFWELARESLHFVAACHGIADRALLDDVLSAYRTLDAYPEVPGMLRTLRAQGISRAVLSNGGQTMLTDAFQAAGIGDLLDAILSVESARVYKPDPRVYRLATDRFGLPATQIAFVSSNPWDAFGAREFGFRVFWINRTSQPDEYGLQASVTQLRDLTELPDLNRNPPLEAPGGAA